MSDNIVFDIIARDYASRTFKAVENATDRTGARLGKLGRTAALAATGFASMAGAAGVFVYKVGSSYVDSLNKIQALTGANHKTMEAAAKQLESNAGLYAKMGQTTGDAAAGVVELTKAGLSLHDSLKSINATMVLAKAGELSVADASTLVANSLNTFGLKAGAAGKLANQLANAANISSADVSDLAESFKYVSPVAASAGVSIGETSAILAELSNSGIKASSAGTALRTFLLNLQAPAKAGANVLADLNVQVFDAQGNMKPLPDIIGQLGGALNKLPASEKAADLKALFGKVGIAGATTILNQGKQGLAEYEKGVNKAGAASKLAEAKSKGLAGTFASIKAQVISAAQAIYREYSPALDARLRTFIQQFKDGSGAGGKFRDALKNVASIAATLWPSMQKLAEYTGNFLGYLASHKTELKVLAASLVALKGASVLKGSGAFSLGKSLTGGGLGGLGRGVVPVFVTNKGFGSGGGPGGLLKTGEKVGVAGALASATELAGAAIAAGALGYIAIHVQGGPQKTNGEGHPYQQGRPGGMSPADWKAFDRARMSAQGMATDLKAVATGLDSVKSRAAAASRELDLAGPHAKRSYGEASVAIGQPTTALDALKGRAAAASQQIERVGPNTKSTAAVAVAALSNVRLALMNLRDRKFTVTADTSQAMANLSVMKYELDQLHNKTIIVRAIGGHVPGEPTSAGGGGGDHRRGGAGSGGSFRGMGLTIGRSLMAGIVKGIAGRRFTVQAAFDKVSQILSRNKEKLSRLNDTRAGFAATFGAENLFGTDVSGANGSPGGIAALVTAASNRATQARQLEADVQTVIGRGLSKSLVKQLQSQGASGAAALHALATGSPAQIAQLNAFDRATSDALRAAGISAGNYVRGGSINADIARARKQDHVLNLLEHHLRELAHHERKGETIVVKIGDDAIIKAINRYEHRKGKK